MEQTVEPQSPVETTTEASAMRGEDNDQPEDTQSEDPKEDANEDGRLGSMVSG